MYCETDKGILFSKVEGKRDEEEEEEEEERWDDEEDEEERPFM